LKANNVAKRAALEGSAKPASRVCNPDGSRTIGHCDSISNDRTHGKLPFYYTAQSRRHRTPRASTCPHESFWFLRPTVYGRLLPPDSTDGAFENTPPSN